MIAEGKTLDEVKKFYKIKDRPAAPGRPKFLSLPEVMRLEITPKRTGLAPKKAAEKSKGTSPEVTPCQK